MPTEISADCASAPVQTRSGGPIAANAGAPANRIVLLDGYRALAIAAVLFHHYTVRWAPPMDPKARFPAGSIFNGVVPFEYGWLGVELFFVISGFVILMTLHRSQSVVDFACRRFARLWPPLIVAACLTTAVLFAIGPDEWQVNARSFLASVVLFDPPTASELLHIPKLRWVDGAYWSLFTEIRFYAIAAIIFLLWRRKFVQYWLGFQVIAFAASLLTRHMGLGQHLLAILCFPVHLPYFTTGICVYEIYSKGSSRRFAAVGAAIAAAIILFNVVSGYEIYNGKSMLVGVAGNLMILGLFVLFIRDHPLVGFFKLGPVVAVGQASYSLYLIHQYIGVSIMRKCAGLGVPYLIVLPVTVTAITAVALLMFRQIEVPAKAWLLNRSKPLIRSAGVRAPWQSYGAG